MLIDAAAALGRERSEVGATHQPVWERRLKIYLRAAFVGAGPRLQLIL
jgi:hypothetical protein